MRKGTPPTSYASTLVIPGTAFEESFRQNFTTALWAYAKQQGLLVIGPSKDKEAVKEEYRFIVDELTMLGEWLPLPVPGQSQTEWICAYLLWCKTQ